MKINVLLKEGKYISQTGVTYAIYTGNNLVVTLESNEQFSVPASEVEVFEFEKES